MAKIKMRSTSLANSPEVNVPKFNFCEYEVGAVYSNNETQIDFITDGKSLYVCLVDNVRATKQNIAEQEGLLKLVSQGEQGPKGTKGDDGISGVTPVIGANFDGEGGKQLVITVNGSRKAVSPDLTGPSWKPVLEGNTLSWELTDDKYAPDSIDLMKLRPVNDRPILLRTNSDNTKRSDEVSGPANFIQWKYEGDEYWTNLISISELMNLALAGVSFWEATDGKWHFGHREVVRANYISDKNGRQIISNVRLGDVLFDAGEVPFPDNRLELDALIERINDLEDGLVKSVSVNGGRKETPDINGNVNLNITLDDFDLTPYVKKSDLVKINNHFLYKPNGSDFTIDVPSFDGLEDIQFRVNNNKLQFRKKEIDSVWSGWTDIMTISDGGNGEHVELKIENGVLKIKYDNGSWQTVGSVGGGSGNGNTINGFVDVSISGRILTFTRQDGTTKQITLPSSGDGTGLSEDDVRNLIGRALEGLLNLPEYVKDPNDNYFVRIYDLNDILSNYYTKSQVYSKGEIDQMLTGTVPHNRTFMIFKRSASSTTETLPNTAITWNVTEGTLDIPTGSNGWTEHPANASSETPYLWVAYATFESLHGERVGNWDGPFCLTGERGIDGEDGKGIEFIYHLGPMGVGGAKPSAPNIDYTKSKKGSDTNDRTKSWWATEASEDSCPGDGNNGYWTDNPTGIDDVENEKVEWASIRKSHYDSTNEVTVWEDFCPPFIWSMWGEDGVDGDGVEYLFCVTATEAEMEVFRNLIPIKGQTYNDFDTRFPNYQTSDWYPKDGQGNANKWTDNPLSVSTNQPYEWVAIRKKNGTTGEWSYFSDPKVWGLWGQKTVYETTSDIIYNNKPYTCYAFARSVDDLTTRVIKTTWEYNNQTYNQWIAEDPSREADFYVNPLNYIITLKPKANTQNEWEIDANVTWSDSVPASNSPSEDLYLITNLIGDEEEEETAWDGPVRWGDSTGFQTEYAAETTETTAVYNKTLTLPRLDTYETADPSLDPDGDGINEDAWRTAVSNAGMGVWKDDNTIVNPVYMATCYKKANGYWSAWTVTKVKGENGIGIDGTPGADGKSIEFVYYRTKGAEPGIEFLSEVERGTYDPEDASTRTKVNKDPELDDFFPAVDIATKTDGDYWHDHPKGVNETYTHEWVATRTSAIQNGKRYWTSNFSVALWSKFGANGRDGDGIEYVFWGLSDADLQALTSYWPTQKSRNSLNNGSNVQPGRKDTPNNRSITDNGYLPALAIGNEKRQAVDNNPGIANNQHVFASIRRYNGSTKEWGEFSEIKLWNEQNNSTLENVVLDITDDKHQILVDENGVIKDSDLQFRCNTSTMSLYKDLVLIGNGKVFVNDVLLAYDNPAGTGSNRMVVTNNTATVECNGVTASVIATSAYKNEDSNTSSINLRVTFQANTVLKDAFVIPITVVDISELYSAVDSLSIVPVLDKGPELTHVPNVQKTSGEGTHDYGQTDLSFWGTPIYGTLEQVMPTEYWFGYDGKNNQVNFKLTETNKNYLRTLDDGTALHAENFYFDRNGNQVNSNTTYYFRIQINNTDYNDNLDPYRKWTSTGYVRLSSFDSNADEQTENYPIDEMLFGIGVDGTMTDDATVYIVYPGKKGDPGQNGSYKKELYCLGVVDNFDGKWQSSYATTGATISALTTAPNAWSEVKPTITSSKPHIWMIRADVTIGRESTQVRWEEPIRITPVDGNVTHTYEHTYEYLAGTIMRTSAWSAGVNDTTKYWDGNTRVITVNGVENASSTDEGIKYLDVVSVTNTSNGVTKTRWFKCILNHTKTSSLVSPVDDDTRWAEFSIMGDGAFHDLLVENAAYIESLASKQVVITDSNNAIVAGMASNSDVASASNTSTVGNVRIWAGAPTTSGDLTTAPFTVDKNGKLIASDAEVTGLITSSTTGTTNVGVNGNTTAPTTTSITLSAGGIRQEYVVNSPNNIVTNRYAELRNGTLRMCDAIDTDWGNATSWTELNTSGLDFTNNGYVVSAITSPTQYNVGSFPSNILRSIEVVNAMPSNPDSETLYIVISS